MRRVGDEAAELRFEVVGMVARSLRGGSFSLSAAANRGLVEQAVLDHLGKL